MSKEYETVVRLPDGTVISVKPVTGKQIPVSKPQQSLRERLFSRKPKNPDSPKEVRQKAEEERALDAAMMILKSTFGRESGGTLDDRHWLEVDGAFQASGFTIDAACGVLEKKYNHQQLAVELLKRYERVASVQVEPEARGSVEQQLGVIIWEHYPAEYKTRNPEQ